MSWMDDLCAFFGDGFFGSVAVLSAIILMALMACAIVIGPIALAVAWFDSSQPHFTLAKADWQCAAQHSVTSTTFIMAGKVMVPTTSTRQVCDAYERGVR